VRVSIETRYSDYDPGGHVNNACYVTYFEMARGRAWVEAMGMPPEFPFVVSEALVRYVRQARLGDPLDVEVTTTDVREKSWLLRYRVLDRRDDRLIAYGHTVQVMFDYATQQSVEIPAELRAKLAAV